MRLVSKLERDCYTLRNTREAKLSADTPIARCLLLNVLTGGLLLLRANAEVVFVAGRGAEPNQRQRR